MTGKENEITNWIEERERERIGCSHKEGIVCVNSKLVRFGPRLYRTDIIRLKLYYRYDRRCSFHFLKKLCRNV